MNEEIMTGFGLVPLHCEGTMNIELFPYPLQDRPSLLYANWELLEFGVDYKWNGTYAITIYKGIEDNTQMTFIYEFRNQKGDNEIKSLTTEIHYPEEEEEEENE